MPAPRENYSAVPWRVTVEGDVRSAHASSVDAALAFERLSIDERETGAVVFSFDLI